MQCQIDLIEKEVSLLDLFVGVLYFFYDFISLSNYLCCYNCCELALHIMCIKVQSRYMSRKAPFLQAANFPNFGNFEYNHESRNHESQFWYYVCNFGSVSVPAKNEHGNWVWCAIC